LIFNLFVIVDFQNPEFFHEIYSI